MNRREFTLHTVMGIAGSMFFGCGDHVKFPFKQNQIIACIGDSVTFANGNGYVEILQQLADKKRPELNLTFLNWGMNSETITGLTEKDHPGPRPYLFDRLDSLLANTPIDFAFFCYGINCGIYGKPSKKLFASYTKGIQSYLDAVQQKGIKAILLTPPPLASIAVPSVENTDQDYSWKNPYPAYDTAVLSEFKNIVLRTKHDAVHTKIDIHGPLKKKEASCYEKDPIHPNGAGHRLIADTIIDHLGF